MSRPLRNLAMVAVAACVLLAAFTLIVLPRFPGVAKGLIEGWADHNLGRSLRIDGDLELDIGRQLTATANSITLANPPWATGASLASAQRLSITLDLWSLIDAGPIHIHAIALHGSTIDLEENSAGQATWQLELKDDDSDHGDSSRVVIERIEVRDLKLRFASPGLDKPLLLTVASLDQAIGTNGLLDTRLDGSINKEPLTLRGQIGPLDQLIEGRDIRLKLDGQLATLTFSTTATIDDLVNPVQPAATLDINAPNVGDISELLGTGRVSDGPLKLQARIEPHGTGVRIGLDAQAGENTFDVSGEIGDLRNLDQLDIRTATRGPHLDRVGRIFGLRHWPDIPFSGSSEVRRNGRQLTISPWHVELAEARFDVNATLVDFPTLDDATVELQVNGDDLALFREIFQLPGVATGPFKIDGKLMVSATGNEFIDLAVDTGLGSVTVSGPLGEKPDYVGTTLTYSAKGPNLRALGDGWGIPNLIARPFSVTGSATLVKPGVISEKRATLTAGEHQLELSGLVNIDPISAGTDVQLRLSGPDAAALLAMAGLDKALPAKPYEASGRFRVTRQAIEVGKLQAGIAGTQFFADGTLGRSANLAGSEITIAASGPALGAIIEIDPELSGYLPAGPFEFRTRLRIGADAYLADDMSSTIGQAELRGSARITRQPGFAGSELSLSGGGADLAALLPELPGFKLPAGPFRISGRVEKGDSRIRLDEFRLEHGGATARASADIGLPAGDAPLDFNVDLRGPDASVFVPQLGEYRPPASPFTVIASGNLTDGRLRLGPSNLQLGDARLRVDEFRATGTAADPVSASGRIAVSIPSMAGLGSYGGRQFLDQALELSAQLKDEQSSVTIDKLEAVLGQSDASGRIVFTPGDVPLLDIQLNSKRIHRPQLFADRPDSTAGKPAESPAKSGARVIPETPLPFEQLTRLDFNADIKVASAQIQQFDWNDLAFDAELRAGTLRIRNLQVEGPTGKLTANLTARQDAITGGNIGVSLKATDLNTGLFAADDTDLQLLPKATISLDLQGSGHTIRELAASLNGHGNLTGSEGRWANSRIANMLLGSFFEELLESLNPFVKQEPYTQVQCAAIPFSVTNGVFENQPMTVLQTDKLTILARGKIDLGSEKLDLNYRTEARKGLGVSAADVINPFIKVSGTLAKPKLTVDAKGTLVSGGAAVATGGISILAQVLWRRVSRAKDPCAEVIAEYDKLYPQAAN